MRTRPFGVFGAVVALIAATLALVVGGATPASAAAVPVASWIAQNSGEPTALLQGVDFVDANNGWAVGGKGSAGVIVRTTNGGVTWTSQTVTSPPLFGIDMRATNLGWAVGSNGAVFKWDGSNWTSQRSETTPNLRGVSFLDANNGYAVGTGGTILQTTNGGTWTTAATGATAELYLSVKAVTAANILVTGQNTTTNAALLRSFDDTGNSVNNLTFPGGSTLTDDRLRGIEVSGASAWVGAGSSGKGLSSLNQGGAWADMTTPLASVAGFSFIDAGNGLVVGSGVGSGSPIARTFNGGGSWALETVPGTGLSLQDVKFVDATHGWAVGAQGVIVAYVPNADLAIFKSDGVDAVRPGQQVVYSIRATNTSTTTGVPDARVVDTFPADLGSVSWTCDGACTNTSGTGNLNESLNLAPGASATFAVTATVAAAPSGPIVNAATVSSATVPDGDTANNSATDTDALAVIDLTVDKSHTGDFFQGGIGRYAIDVTNDGNTPTSGTVTVTDTLPAGLSATGLHGTGWTCTVATVSCTRSDALAGASSYPTITLDVAVGSSASSGDNVVAVSGGSDSNTANNGDTDPTTVKVPVDLAITKTDGTTGVGNGSPVTYTIVATNQGSNPATGASVTDTLPAELTNPTWTCSPDASSSCGASSGTGNIGTTVTMPPGGTVTFAVNATVNATPGATIVNTATITHADEVDPSDNSATDTDTVFAPDLTVTKSHTGNFVQGQTGATYTIAAQNSGDAATTATATVTDTVPTGLTPTGASGPDWTCNIVNQDVTCTYDDPVAATTGYPTITLTVDVANDATNVTNTATVSGGGEVDTTNNSSDDPTTITGACTPVTSTARSLTLGAGAWCLENVTIGGNLRIEAGADVTITNSKVRGTTKSIGATELRICGSELQGLTVKDTIGPVTVGDPLNGCGANVVRGSALFARNTGGVTIGGNLFRKSLECRNNSPVATNGGSQNRVRGSRSGECASRSF